MVGFFIEQIGLSVFDGSDVADTEMGPFLGAYYYIVLVISG